ncbi:MAG: hypothetical protein D6683_11045 [Actinomyces sp.]|nr:MAG: hypothetical protein D6683_11045 [Actinomyces sp.]
MPTGDRAVDRVTAVRLPGASWLDVVSARTAGEILLSVAVPELAALRVAAWVSRAGVSGARLANVVRILVDQGLGFALDVGFQASRVGWDRADLAAIGARSVVDNLAGLVSRGATGAVARGAVSRVGASAALREALADPATRRAAESVVGELLGIPADAAAQLVVESARGHGVSADDVWAALLGSAMNRGLVARLRANRTYRGVAERLESAIDTEAVALDRHLNRQADAAFERVLDDRPLTRESGDAVFEALRLGELTWEQLQRVYKSRGDAMTPLMERVNELRNRLVNSIGTRARLLARQRIAEHYDPLIAAATGAERERLRSEKQAELDKVADPLVEVGVAVRFTEQALELASASRERLIEHLLGALEGDARETRRRELSALDEISLRDTALRRLEADYTAAVRKAAGDEIAPGSAGVTSDVDRSWSSEFLRRAAREIVLVEMTRGRADGEPGPTTARAFDVNEYLNVMTRIPALVKARETFTDRVVATLAVGDTSFELTHADAVEANSLAAAMLHMDSHQRERFAANLTEGLTGDALTRMRAMLEWARSTLADSEAELASYVERMRSRLPEGTLDSEIELRARDELYGDRMRRLDELGHAIDRATDADERARLMSAWELLVNKALRDGIETYSDMANLEIIVIRMQSAGGKPDDLMRSEDFRLGSPALAGITAQQIRAMLNDQILMLMHHVHTLHAGYESPAKAVRSFAKYAERALLALNLLGAFDPDVEGRYSDLYRATRALMRHKNDPQRLVETLADLRGGKRGVEENLRWYLDQIELIPGMAGLTAEPPAGWRPESWARSLSAREWERRRLAAEAAGDSGFAVETAREQAAVTADLAGATAERDRIRAVAEFLATDRDEARRLLEEIAELETRVWFLDREEWGLSAHGHFGGERWRTLTADLRSRRARLAELKRRWEAAGRPVDEALQRRLAVLERRIAALTEMRRAHGANLARAAAGRQGGSAR